MSANFTFDDKCLNIQNFTIEFINSSDGNLTVADGAAEDRYLYGNGQMTGICYVSYTYISTDTDENGAPVTCDADDVSTVENYIKANITFLDKATQSNITSLGWTYFNSDDDGRNDQYYHDYKVVCTNAVPSAVISGNTINNSVPFYLLPPSAASSSSTTTIYAFYPPQNPSDPTYTIPTTPTNPYSTYGTCNIDFNVTPPTASTESFAMIPVWPSADPVYGTNNPIIYAVDYSAASKQASDVAPYIMRWKLTDETSDYKPDQIVNIQQEGQNEGFLSLYTQAGGQGGTGTIFACEWHPTVGVWDKTGYPM